MHYSTFLIDLDHTLFDSDASETAAFAQTMRSAGVSKPEKYSQIYHRINMDLWAAVERGEATPQQVRTRRFEQLVAEIDLNANPLVMADTFVDGLGANGELYRDAREVLDELSGRASLALVTNGLSEVQRARIERLDIGQYFDAVVISAEIGAAKPGTAIFDHTFDQLNSPAKDSTLMVGDSLSSDIQGGINYEIATCWFNPNGSTDERSKSITHEIRSLEELLVL